MRPALRSWFSSPTVLVAVILALALVSNASPAKTDLARQSTFSIHQEQEHVSLAVGATEEVEDYTGYQVWRFDLLGEHEMRQEEGLERGKAAKLVMDVAQASLTSVL